MGYIILRALSMDHELGVLNKYNKQKCAGLFWKIYSKIKYLGCNSMIRTIANEYIYILIKNNLNWPFFYKNEKIQ